MYQYVKQVLHGLKEEDGSYPSFKLISGTVFPFV